MRIFIGILVSVMAVLIIIVGTIFGLRIYNTFEHGIEDNSTINHHRYTQYEDAEGTFTTTHFTHERANGLHLVPDESNGNTKPVVMLSGSEGSINFEFATTLAEAGFEVYTLFYFGGSNQPSTLEHVPLEFFGDFLEHAEFEDTAVTVIGHEKGSELALVLTNFYDNIDSLVLYDPLPHVFAGLTLTLETQSPWSFNEEPVTYIDLRDADMMTLGRSLLNKAILAPSDFRGVYESALENTNDPELARIPTTNFNGPALIFAGAENPKYPGDVFARELGQTMDSAEVHVLENVGYAFFRTDHYEDIHVGGEEEANAQAREDSLEILIDFLNRE